MGDKINIILEYNLGEYFYDSGCGNDFFNRIYLYIYTYCVNVV